MFDSHQFSWPADITAFSFVTLNFSTVPHTFAYINHAVFCLSTNKLFPDWNCLDTRFTVSLFWKISHHLFPLSLRHQIFSHGKGQQRNFVFWAFITVSANLAFRLAINLNLDLSTRVKVFRDFFLRKQLKELFLIYRYLKIYMAKYLSLLIFSHFMVTSKKILIVNCMLSLYCLILSHTSAMSRTF